MALKFKLQRYGKKGRPFYHVVVTDSRNARNSGRFIERVGTYDPIPEKSAIHLVADRMVHWYKVGARPTDSVKALLRVNKVDLAALAKN